MHYTRRPNSRAGYCWRHSRRPACLPLQANLTLAGGNCTVLPLGTNRVVGPVDLDALVNYVESLSQPFTYSIEGRINRIN